MDEKDLPQRKPTRWSGFDYSRGGAYFITICTQDRKRILSKIEGTETTKPVGEGFALGVSQNEQKTTKPVGEGSALGVSRNEQKTTKPVGEGSALSISRNEQKTTKPVGEGSALPHLTLIGQITQDWLNEINDHFPSAELGEYVIMPNHIHLILFLEDTSGRADPSPTVSNIIGWLKYNITKDVNLPKGQKLFQRSFYDRVIRNRDEHMEICNYITLNPENWENDELYI